MRAVGWTVLLSGACGLGMLDEARAEDRADPLGCRENPEVGQAETAYRQLLFDRAAALTERARARPGNCPAELFRLFVLDAQIAGIRGELAQCQRAFEVVLALRPLYVPDPDRTPPRVGSCFEAARAVPASDRALRFEALAPVVRGPRQPALVPFRLEDPLKIVDHVRVLYRRAGEATFRAEDAGPLADVGAVPGSALPEPPEPYSVEVIVQGVDRFGGVVVQSGSLRRPIVFEVRATGAPPFWRRWWFWTAVGALAAGGVTAAVVTSQGEGPLVGVPGGFSDP